MEILLLYEESVNTASAKNATDSDVEILFKSFDWD